jgi:hypothetical protein
MTLKMALLAPMESASVSTMTMIKPGVRPRVRMAYRKSFQMVSNLRIGFGRRKRLPHSYLRSISGKVTMLALALRR